MRKQNRKNQIDSSRFVNISLSEYHFVDRNDSYMLFRKVYIPNQNDLAVPVTLFTLNKHYIGSEISSATFRAIS